MTAILLIEPNTQLCESVAMSLTTTGGYQVFQFPSFDSLNSLTSINTNSCIDGISIDLLMFPARFLVQFKQSGFSKQVFILTTSIGGELPKQCLGTVLLQQVPIPAIAEQVRQLINTHVFD